MNFNTIRFKLPALIICAFIISSSAILVITGRHVIKTIDESEDKEYGKKVQTMLLMLDSHNERLQRTHREEAYLETFQRMAIKSLEDIFSSSEEQQITRFVIDIKGGKMLFFHPQQFSVISSELLLEKLSESDSDSHSFTIKSDEAASIYYGKFEPWGWTVGYVLPLEIKYATALHLRDTLGLTMGAITILMAIVLSVMVRRQVEPILELTKISSAMAKGELDQEIDVCRNDEVGTLAESFRKMKNSIGESMEALAENERFLDKVVENIPNMIFVKDAKELRFVRLNRAGEQLLGLKRGELIGKNDYDFFPVDQAHILTGKDREVLENKQLLDIPEEAVETAGQGIRILHTRKIPILGNNGKAQYLLEISEDVTERKHAEEELQQSRDFLQTVIDGFPEQMMVINTDYTIALANKSTAVAVGRAPADLIGRSCHEVTHGSANPCKNKDHTCPLMSVIETKAPVTVEHLHYDTEGKERNIELSAAPILDSNGEVFQIIESLRDITERRIAEEAAIQLERQMQHAQKLESLGVLAGGIAHDFNNILMGVLGNAELSLHELSPESPVRDNIKDIFNAALRAAELSKQMLAYSGRGQFIVETINVNRLVSEMTHLLKTTISKAAVLKFDFSENISLIDADITQVRQVFMNLITNAAEAIEDKSGVITVSTGMMEITEGYLDNTFVNEDVSEGYYTFIEVSDTGCGMDKETQGKIFDPFFTTKFTGRGLGMSATLGIIRGHKGAIKVYSEPGKGTSIKVLFPCSEKSQDAEDKVYGDNGSLVPQKWQGQGTILVVDDEETVRAIAKKTLVGHGFDVLTAEDGREGLKLFEENVDDITLVLLDMMMPHMGGEEAFSEMRKIRHDVKVMLSSGYNEQEATNRFAGKGLAGFIQKPYMPSELIARLHELLGEKETV